MHVMSEGLPMWSHPRVTIAEIGKKVKVPEYTVLLSLLNMGLHNCRSVRLPMLTPTCITTLYQLV